MLSKGNFKLPKWSKYKPWVTALLALISMTFVFIFTNLEESIFIFLMLDISQFELNCQINWFNLIFIILLISVARTIFYWARYYMTGSQRLEFFYYRFLRFVMSMSVLLLRNRLFWVFLGWEGLGVSSFMLIVFFQNWNRTNRGLLTLLTNRFGDALLLIIFRYWMNTIRASRLLKFSLARLIILIFLSFTKRAQWPFIRWLPAAIAAPTPVSALVHSSTLVTAGIWLLLTFSTKSLLALNLWIIFGSLTLIVASLAALLEIDAKKIVALSTLRQLGLILFRLGVGTSLICFFHIIMHALAKANLFIVVGGALHHVYSEQDARFLTRTGFSTSRGAFIRVISLRGLCFISGFYSKEIILRYCYSQITRWLSFAIFVVFIRFTLSYRFSLIRRLRQLGNKALSTTSNRRINFSVLVTSSLTIISGWIRICSIPIKRVIYTPNLLFLILFIRLTMIFFKKTGNGFNMQNKITKIITKILSFYKATTKNISPGLYETLLIRLTGIKSIKYPLSRTILTISLLLYTFY